MTGGFTSDQEELRRYVRQWLDEKAPLDDVRRVMESTGVDIERWPELGELGWLGMAIPEEFGGAGYGFAEVAILAEEMGRSLYASPFLATAVLSAGLIDLGASEAQRANLLGSIASGQLRLAAAVGEDKATWKVDGFSTSATKPGDDWLVTGVKAFVIDGATAESFVVAADVDGTAELFVVDAATEGVVVVPLEPMDLTRPLAEVTFQGARGDRLEGGQAPVALAGARDRGVAFVAMEQVGGAQACLEMSVAYAKERHQFGRPIGSFQAIKHMCADMLVSVESARSAAYHLALCLDSDPDEASVAVPLAKAYCSEAYYQAAADTIQIHGGIGFTWEHSAHLYFKRAKSSALLFGPPADHRRVLADQIGL